MRLGGDGAEHRAERACAGPEAGGRHYGADGSVALCRPHDPIAVGDLALDDSRTEVVLAGIVHRLDLTGEGGEGQKLVAGAPHPVADVARQIAGDRGGEDGVERLTRGPAFRRDRRDREGSDAPGQGKGRAEPQLEPQRDGSSPVSSA